ncbi:hypothetical protein HDU93_006268 [Gonapodya sp. JEL0774]|nr:hypothetical protein HDU93_006268 [Gonapodya sp. JEL0774]
MTSTVSGLYVKSQEVVAIPLQQVSADVALVDCIASVTLCQRYFHVGADPVVEAIYKFPIYESAAVYAFEAVVDGMVIKGVCRDQRDAYADYQNALKSGDRAFLLEEQKADSNAQLSLDRVYLDRDFVLVVKSPGLDQPQAILERSSSGTKCAMATFVPKFASRTVHTEMIFVIDRGGHSTATPTSDEGRTRNATPKSEEGRARNANAERLSVLVQLQKFDGSFQADRQLFSLASTPEDLAMLGTGYTESEWATAVAISLMEIALQDIAEEWELMREKSIAWLDNCLGSIKRVKLMELAQRAVTLSLSSPGS